MAEPMTHPGDDPKNSRSRLIGRILLTLLALVVPITILELLGQSPSQGTVIGQFVAGAAFCLLWAWFWFRVVGKERPKLYVSLGAMAALLTMMGLTMGLGNAFFYLAIMVGVSFSWRRSLMLISLVSLGGIITIALWLPWSTKLFPAVLISNFISIFIFGAVAAGGRQLFVINSRLAAARAELQAATERKSAFLASMSHELRTPMSAIIGFSDLILAGADGELSEDLKDDVEQINESSKTLLQLINDILDLSKIEAGRMILEIEELDISSVVAEVVGNLRPLAMSRSLSFVAEVPSRLPKVRADQMRIRQIVTNLVSNALKFTQEGGITIRCRLVGSMVEVSVIDTGIGLAPESLGKIFEEFVQAEDGTARKFGGTGLGLAITRKLIALQNGEIGVESTLGLGSRFWFTLPMVPGSTQDSGDASHAGDPAAAPSGHTASGHLVLIVNHQAHAQEMLERRLTEATFATVAASNASEALTMAIDFKPSAIALDIMMPEADGWRILSELKSNPHTVDIPVVLVGMVDGHQQVMDMGASAFLAKPISGEVLSSTMQALLPALQGADVLCVDDEESARELVQRNLHAAGARVRLASSGAEALREIDRTVPDVILADLMMPEMNGFELISLLRTRSTLERVPIIVLSAKDLSPEDVATLSANVDQFLHKFASRPDDIVRAITRSIESRRAVEPETRQEAEVGVQ